MRNITLYSVTYVLEWMGLHSYDYDGLQPKITPPPNISAGWERHSDKNVVQVKYKIWV